MDAQPAGKRPPREKRQTQYAADRLARLARAYAIGRASRVVKP